MKKIIKTILYEAFSILQKSNISQTNEFYFISDFSINAQIISLISLISM